MAKKKKNVRGRRHNVASLVTLSPDELQEKGAAFLREEKFQDALLCFKQLLKQGENSPQVLEGLAQAYVGRIEALAAKSMIKEAMVMLDTMIGLCPDAQVDALQLSLLLRAGRFAEAARLYTQRCRTMAPDRLPRLEALFGALLVAGVEGLRAEDFGEGSPIAQHYSAALAALEKFFAGRDSETQDALKQIPLRSPYRDLRTLLTGLLQLGLVREKGEAFLRKIKDDSPYFHYAAGYLAADTPPETLLHTLAAAPKQDHQLLREQYGLSLPQFQLLLELSQTDGKTTSLYRLVRKHGHCFTRRQRIEIMKNILPFCHDQAFDVLQQSADFDKPETCRISALAAEKDGAFDFAVMSWDEYLDTIDEQDQARHKEIALVMRHQARLMPLERYEVYDVEDILATMLESLKYDPSHVPTWLGAAEFAGRHLSWSQQYTIINDAVKKLPENVNILIAAMKACGQKGAYKKASGLARRVLAIDPINTSALDFLVQARLEHGRKLAKQKKWLLAEQELLAADTRVKAVRLRGRHRICLGMLQLVQDNAEGLALIEAGRRENGSLFFGHLLTALEARLYRLPPGRRKDFDRELLSVTTTADVDRNEFLRLMSWILDFDGDQWLALHEICQLLKKYFSRAAQLEWSRDEGLSICKALDHAGLSSALAKCSAQLYKKFADDPEVTAWYLLGKYEHRNRIIADDMADLAVRVLDQLERKNCFTMAERIEEVLEADRRLRVYRSDREHDKKDYFDDGPFKIPEKAKRDKEPEAKPKVEPVRGRQLNLFDDPE
ncbi:tetratricopeptide repeat protein [Desulfocastanea catecholica]